MAAAVGYEDYAVAALPAAVRNWAGELIAIPSYSEHPQEAFDLITKIPSGEFDEKMAMASNGIPADTRNEEWPEMLAGVREAFNVQTGVYDWNCGLNENGDLGTAFQDPAAKLFEGSLDGQGFVEAIDALYQQTNQEGARKPTRPAPFSTPKRKQAGFHGREKNHRPCYHPYQPRRCSRNH